MIRSRRVLARSLLPPGFTQLNYLQSNGTQVIDLEFVSTTGNHSVKCEFATVNSSTSNAAL